MINTFWRRLVGGGRRSGWHYLAVVTCLLAACAGAPEQTATPGPGTAAHSGGYPAPPTATPGTGAYPPPATASPAPYAGPPGSVSAGELTTVALKATSEALMALTLTARPTATDTPTVPPGAPPCQASDLDPSAAAEGAGGAVTMTLLLTNTSQAECYLQGPPEVHLLSPSGTKLNVLEFQRCFQCPPGEEAALLAGRLGLRPGQSAAVFLIWTNWCGHALGEGNRVQLVLAQASLEAALPSGLNPPRCDVPAAPSRLMVSHFFYPE